MNLYIALDISLYFLGIEANFDENSRKNKCPYKRLILKNNTNCFCSQKHFKCNVNKFKSITGNDFCNSLTLVMLSLETPDFIRTPADAIGQSELQNLFPAIDIHLFHILLDK